MSRLRRIARHGAAVTASLLSASALWAAFMLCRNPEIEAAEPRIVVREPMGEEVTVVLAGDFAPTDYAMPFIERWGYRYPYRATAPILQRADVAFANLEAPVTESDQSFWPYKDWLYRVSPDAVPAWQWLGLDVVSLANNHLIDYRRPGLLDTLHHLSAAGIEQVGAGADEREARRPVVFDVGGTRIGFLAYLEQQLAFDLYLGTFAIGAEPGCAQLNAADVGRDVRRLRPLVDLLVVSVHWGKNYSGVDATQERYARLFADLGVDVVAGHHAHDVQPVEIIGHTVVFYSLGNYAWGALGWPELRVGLLARLVVERGRGSRPRLTRVELIPIATQNRIVDYQPRPLRPEELPWLDGLRAQSTRRGVNLVVREGRLDVPLPWR